jgi:hypothetical protein
MHLSDLWLDKIHVEINAFLEHVTMSNRDELHSPYELGQAVAYLAIAKILMPQSVTEERGKESNDAD